MIFTKLLTGKIDILKTLILKYSIICDRVCRQVGLAVG